MLKKLLALLFAGALLGGFASAETNAPFSAKDRLLIIAPHPDDETLGAGGVLQKAIAGGASVRVLYLTNGELNEVASIFYQKRPLLVKSDFIKIGKVRRNEAVEAMAFLGLQAKDLVFFGYPDGGLLNIWYKFWDTPKAYRSFFTRINKVPFKDNFSYENAYRGESVLRDLERVLLEYQPTAVYVTAPFDLNHDHQAAYLFAEVALRNLKDQLVPFPELRLYVVHAHRWPNPKAYRPDLALGPPPHVQETGELIWSREELTPEEATKKQETLLRYRSQIAYKKNFLLAFARSNELFAQYPPERLTREEGPEREDVFDSAPEPGNVRFRIYNRDLWVEVPMSSALDEMGVLSVYVYGYRTGFLFSEMPKFSFKLFGNKLFAYEGFKNFHDPDLIYRFDKDRMILRIPMRLLKDPDALFVSSRNAKEEMSLDFGTWRLLEVV